MVDHHPCRVAPRSIALSGSDAQVRGLSEEYHREGSRVPGLGAEVILMTPTYTDERFSTYFNVAMTRRFLEAYVSAVRQLDIRQLDYCAFGMTICDNDTEPKQGIAFFLLVQIDAVYQSRRLDLLTIVDRNGAFPGNETTNVHLFQ